MKKMSKKKKFIFIPFGIAAFLALISYVVMLLWNGLLPDILHVGTITFWQAMGIFVLCKILFGFGKGGRMGGAPWMRNREHFRNMSDEEKEAFKSKLKERMCWTGEHRKSAAEPGTVN